MQGSHREHDIRSGQKGTIDLNIDTVIALIAYLSRDRSNTLPAAFRIVRRRQNLNSGRFCLPYRLTAFMSSHFGPPGLLNHLVYEIPIGLERIVVQRICIAQHLADPLALALLNFPIG